MLGQEAGGTQLVTQNVCYLLTCPFGWEQGWLQTKLCVCALVCQALQDVGPRGWRNPACDTRCVLFVYLGGCKVMNPPNLGGSCFNSARMQEIAPPMHVLASSSDACLVIHRSLSCSAGMSMYSPNRKYH
eukprot:4964321-Amphidinium_carterae.2